MFASSLFNNNFKTAISSCRVACAIGFSECEASNFRTWPASEFSTIWVGTCWDKQIPQDTRLEIAGDRAQDLRTSSSHWTTTGWPRHSLVIGIDFPQALKCILSLEANYSPLNNHIENIYMPNLKNYVTSSPASFAQYDSFNIFQ